MSEPIPPQPPYTPPYTNAPFAAVPNAAAAEYPPRPGYPPQPGTPLMTGSSGLSETTAAALAYVTIIPAIVFLLLEPYNRMRFVRFHSVQCLGLFVVSFVLQIGLTITQIFLHFIPFIGILFAILHLVIFLGIFVAWLLRIIKASRGEWYKLPVIGDFALKQASL